MVIISTLNLSNSLKKKVKMWFTVSTSDPKLQWIAGEHTKEVKQ